MGKKISGSNEIMNKCGNNNDWVLRTVKKNWRYIFEELDDGGY